MIPKGKFIVPDRGDKVDSSIGLSYPPASLCSLAGGTATMPEIALSSVSDYEFGFRVAKLKLLSYTFSTFAKFQKSLSQTPYYRLNI
jgi:hypothetical protein